MSPSTMVTIGLIAVTLIYTISLSNEMEDIKRELQKQRSFLKKILKNQGDIQ